MASVVFVSFVVAVFAIVAAIVVIPGAIDWHGTVTPLGNDDDTRLFANIAYRRFVIVVGLGVDNTRYADVNIYVDTSHCCVRGK
jgi:hypothetical protein